MFKSLFFRSRCVYLLAEVCTGWWGVHCVFTCWLRCVRGGEAFTVCLPVGWGVYGVVRLCTGRWGVHCVFTCWLRCVRGGEAVYGVVRRSRCVYLLAEVCTGWWGVHCVCCSCFLPGPRRSLDERTDRLPPPSAHPLAAWHTQLKQRKLRNTKIQIQQAEPKQTQTFLKLRWRFVWTEWNVHLFH